MNLCSSRSLKLSYPRLTNILSLMVGSSLTFLIQPTYTILYPSSTMGGFWDGRTSTEELTISFHYHVLHNRGDDLESEGSSLKCYGKCTETSHVHPCTSYGSTLTTVDCSGDCQNPSDQEKSPVCIVFDVIIDESF